MRVRTSFSFRRATGTIAESLKRQQEIGYPAAIISDSSAFGYVGWLKATKKANTKPIFGIEINITPSIHEKKPATAPVTFYARNSMVPLHALIELSTAQFRYTPLLSWEDVSRIDPREITTVLGSRAALTPEVAREGTYLALSPSLARGQALRAKEKGIPLIASSENAYITEDQARTYEIAAGMNASTQSYPQHLLSADEWFKSVEHIVPTGEAIEAWANFEKVCGDLNPVIAAGQIYHPKRPATLHEMCEQGATRLNCDLNDPVYAARLERELNLIVDKGFEDYFYIIADLVAYARGVMLVGPARGSSCGSLVCYLLGITSIDPIPYGLLFERFLDPTRKDLPDIDIDFSETRRHLAFEHMANKYGPDHVARLGTVMRFGAKSALQEAAGALGIPRWEADKVLEGMIQRSSGDARALDTLIDTLRDTVNGSNFLNKYPEAEIAGKLEGLPKTSGQHAAGIILTDRPVVEYVAIDARTNSTQCDKKDAEELGLLKIDALGLTQLSVFEDCLELAGLPHTFLDNLPMDDQASFDVLNRGHYSGIFQMNGLAVQGLAKQIKVSEFNDIVALGALARPGPLVSGAAGSWVKRKNGTEQITYPHPTFEPHLRDTMGVISYQETIMSIGRHIGDLSFDDVAELRKAMSKSLGKEYFSKWGDKFVAGAVSKGMDRGPAQDVWDAMCTFGSWAFNKSHAVAYGMITYQCCYLKAHYPVEFAAATLSHEGKADRQIKILRELEQEGIGFIAVDAETSTDKWQVKKNKDGSKVLVGPLSAVHGIGGKAVDAIITARRSGLPIPPRYAKALANPKTPFKSLYPIRDGIARVCPDLSERNILSTPTEVIKINPGYDDEEYLVLGTFLKINPRDQNEEILKARRGGKEATGKTKFLNLQLADDTDVIFCKVGTWAFDKVARDIIDRGKPGVALYAVKLRLRGSKDGPAGFRGGDVLMTRYLGDLETGIIEDMNEAGGEEDDQN